MGGVRGVDAPLGAPTPWATGRSSLVGKWTRGREGEGREGPGRLRREDGDACIDACCPPKRMFHIGAGFATAPCF